MQMVTHMNQNTGAAQAFFLESFVIKISVTQCYTAKPSSKLTLQSFYCAHILHANTLNPLN